MGFRLAIDAPHRSRNYAVDNHRFDSDSVLELAVIEKNEFGREK